MAETVFINYAAKSFRAEQELALTDPELLDVINLKLAKEPELNNFQKWRRIFIPVQGREIGA